MDSRPSLAEIVDTVAKIDAFMAGDHSEENREAMRKSSDYLWPEIQKFLIMNAARKHGVEGDPYEPFYSTSADGTRTLHGSPDAWWLRHFNRKHVILSVPGVAILNTRPWHIHSVCLTLWDAYFGAGNQHTDRARRQSSGETPSSVFLNQQGEFARHIQNMAVGEIYSSIGYTSTSQDPAVAGLFARSRVAEYGESDDCFTEDHIFEHMKRFPMGQFAAQKISGPVAGNCVGMATTMRTSRPPTAPVLSWKEAIGDMTLSAHEPDGEWLYGAEMTVHPRYQRHGIGSGLYRARFGLVYHFNLRGMYMVGMLMGYYGLRIGSLSRSQKESMDRLTAAYHSRKLSDEEVRELKEILAQIPAYSDQMDAQEYGERVIAGEIKDPTVSLQIKLGFRPIRVVPDYCDEPAAGNAGVLLVWENPDYES